MPHAFPADLADDVIARWTTQVVGVFRRPPLPSRNQLRALLEVAYLAALETDEGRPVRLMLCCTPEQDAVHRFQQDEAVEAWPFATPRPYDIDELRRLAQTTDVDGAAVWVQFPADPDGPMKIRGLLNLGNSWAHARDGFALHYDALPDALTVRADAPGCLMVYQGQIALTALASGRIRAVRVASEALHGVQTLVDEGLTHFGHVVPRPQRAPASFAQNFAWTSYVNVLLALLNAIKASGHGGALLIAGRRSPVADPASTMLAPKYRLGASATHLADRYATLLTKRHALADLQWQQEAADADSFATAEPVVPALSGLRLGYSELRDASDALAGAIGFVGGLAGTDGAILLRTDLLLLGFGVEIRLDRAAPAPVHEVLGASLVTAAPLDSEQFGMRHRSAMRLVATAPDVAAFVVSQDGGVSLVFRHGERVCMRRNIDTTSAGMPVA